VAGRIEAVVRYTARSCVYQLARKAIHAQYLHHHVIFKEGVRVQWKTTTAEKEELYKITCNLVKKVMANFFIKLSYQKFIL